MAAVAPTRRAAPRRAPAQAPRRAPARRPARSRPAREHRTPPAGQLIPLAVGRTAVAVRALPDSGLVMGLTRGRAWIPVLGLLLAGIVALNVMSLSLGASSGKVEQQIIGLEQEASALRAQLADRLSSDRVQAEASRLGMVVPAPGDITYLGAGDRATALAGQRLAQGFGPADSLAASETTTTTSPTTLAETPTAVAPDPAATPPATTTPTAASDPASVESTAPAAPTGAPAPSTSAAAAAGSGGISPG
jgi:hypothetical protein